MRKLIIVLAAVLAVALVAIYYPEYVPKPEKDGQGPLAVRLDQSIPAPEYHSPLDWWQTHHMDVVNRGEIEKYDCLFCHEPETSCNNCHGYVGIAAIEDLR